MIKTNLLIQFGHRIRCLRLSLGISQEELAERAGVHRTYVGIIERGEKNITLINASKVANVLGVPMKHLFEGIE